MYGHISEWETSSVTTMYGLFFDKQSFNDNIESWDMSNVCGMFASAESLSNHE